MATSSALNENLVAVDEAIGLCLDDSKVLPALILIYSAVDAVASLERRQGERSKSAFLRWVDRYMQVGVLGCTATDLYGARCGILHGFTGASDLAASRRARVIVYAWGSSSAIALQRDEDRAVGRPPSIAVHVEELRSLFRSGIEAWWNDVSEDPDRLAAVRTSLATWFAVSYRVPPQRP